LYGELERKKRHAKEKCDEDAGQLGAIADQ
jgi:hypothetical protein